MSALERVLFNLNTLAGVPRGGRIDTSREYILVEQSSIFQAAFRTMRSDSKDRAATRIESDVNLAVEFGRLMRENPAAHKKELKNILGALRAASVGVERLCGTYQNWASFLAPMHAVLGVIAAEDSAIVKCLQDLGEY